MVIPPTSASAGRKCPPAQTAAARSVQEKKGSVSPASESWLKGGQRTCSVCQAPLWQEARDRGSRPKPGQKYPPKNPRYRLDEYLRRCYPDRVYLLIWDEVHEAQHGDTGNGAAFGRLAGLAEKVLAMTGHALQRALVVTVQPGIPPQPACQTALPLGRRGTAEP